MVDTADVMAVRRIARDTLKHDIERVDHLDGDGTGPYPERILLEVERPENGFERRNIFTGGNLTPFLAEGYVPTSVGVTTAWFVPIGAGIDVHGY